MTSRDLVRARSLADLPVDLPRPRAISQVLSLAANRGGAMVAHAVQMAPPPSCTSLSNVFSSGSLTRVANSALNGGGGSFSCGFREVEPRTSPHLAT